MAKKAKSKKPAARKKAGTKNLSARDASAVKGGVVLRRRMLAPEK
jgi:hypothetical protein